jgi:drug/metabolite transporter (DMT)-like permease
LSKDDAGALTEGSLVLAAVFWGMNYAATKFATMSVPALPIVAFRFVVGGLLMYGVLRILEPGSRLRRGALLSMAGLGCLGIAVGQTAFTFGLSLTTAANTGLIFATAFAFSAWQKGVSRIGANRVLVYQYLITLTGIGSGVVFFGEALSASKIAGGAVILLGVYLARRR